MRYDSATRWNAVERKIGKDTWEKVSGGRTDLGRALVCDDVREVEISGLTAQAVCTAARPGEQSKTPVLEFRNVRGALIRGCSPPVGTDVFLRITGDKTAKIGAIGNDFRSAAKPVVIEEGARKEETGLESNLGH
ncbi:hypothetical protein HY256_02245 [Candidatus Sumerlaeota bacterium]|nr:hypothetical protein [Candidatus Sumerlaeota bacterium]